jgi:hypothetical protein
MARPHTSDIGSVSAPLSALFKKLEDHAIPVTIDRRHRAAGLLDRLESLGLTLDEQSLKQYLAPVFCVTAEDQARFGTVIADWLAPVRQGRFTIRRSPTGVTDSLRRHDWRYLFVAGLCLVATVAAVLAWTLTSPKNRSIQQPAEEVCKQVPAPPTCTQSPASSTGLRFSGLLENLPARLGLASLPLFGLYLTVRFRRRARANIVRRRGEAAASKLFAIPVEGAGLFGDSGSRSAIFALRRGGLTATNRIDFLRTFAATARTMGWPSIIFATERTSREIVLFVDQGGLADHIQILARSMQERLLAANALLTRYDFRLRPENLRFVSGRLADENVYALDKVVARHAGASLLILSSGDGLFDPSGQLDAGLLPRLAPFASVILLTPTPEANWGERERAFATAGIYVVSATRGGILRATDFLQRDHDEPFLRLQAHIPEGIDPFLTRINRDYYRLSSDLPPDARQIRRIVHDLDQYMAGDDSFCVLAAIAAFPKLDPGITLTLGRLVIGRRVDEEIVAKLARLPWTRDGRMPDWLRIALWNQLPQVQQDKVRAAIDVMLDLAEEIQKGEADWRDMDRRVQLTLARPKTGFLSKVLSDSARPPGMLREQLFLDFMHGVRHDPIKGVLEPEAPGGIRRAFDADFARRTMALYVLFGCLALVLFIEQPRVVGPAGKAAGDISRYIVQPFATWVTRRIAGEQPKADRSSASTDQPSPSASSSASTDQPSPSASSSASTDQPSPSPSSSADQAPPTGQATGSDREAECRRLNVQIAQLQRSYQSLRSELGGGFGTTKEWWDRRGNQLTSEMRKIDANLQETIALRTTKNCPG